MKPLRVLVVDADLPSVMALTTALGQLGHEVCAVVSTASDAVVAAVSFRPDVMVLDYQLREGTGVQAVRAIQVIRHQPFLFATSRPDVVREHLPEAVVVAKPALRGTLQRALSSVRRRAAEADAAQGI
ncbi:MAG TPA: response regulator [Azospirillaceae bacterium]|nr:response regulator [Azospirillaceae bacterium]